MQDMKKMKNFPSNVKIQLTRVKCSMCPMQKNRRNHFGCNLVSGMIALECHRRYRGAVALIYYMYMKKETMR